MLTHVQNDLFDVGADLCTPVVADPEYPPLRISRPTSSGSRRCDEYNEELPKLRSFILPGGTPVAALLHVARTIVPPGRALASGRLLEAARRADEPARDALPQPALATCCSSSPAYANPGGDVLWVPGGERR